MAAAKNRNTQTGDARETGRLVVGIASAGRRDVLENTVRTIALQSRLPNLLLVSVADPADAAGLDRLGLPFELRVLVSPRGLTRQRNRILDEMRAEDLLLFLDDDFLVGSGYLARVEAVFRTYPDVMLATGNLIADGILGPGFDYETGSRLLREGLKTSATSELVTTHTAYGCNMAMRMKPVLRNRLRFDETLPLYGWLEDVDFSTRLRRHGRCVRVMNMRGVHLGTKLGRSSGLRLGYSQIANPVYLTGTGGIGRSRARRLMMRNFAANLRGTLLPKPWTDHRGRLVGNLLAVADLLRGRLSPERASRLGTQAAAPAPAAAPSTAR